MNNFKNFKKFWEKEEPKIVTTSNLEGLSKTFEYDKIDLETIEKVALETFPKIDPYHGLGKPFSITFNEPWVPKEKELVKIPGLTWIDKIEKEFIEDYKQGMIDTILMGDYKKEMKMNRVELEMQRLRESTGENYMLNKMVSTDGVEFFTEYTLYKDYDKYFGLTLDGESLNVIYIMEEEFAEFLSHYRLSAIYPQVEAVHEDTWDITPEENEAIKEQMESGKTDKFTPMYNEDDIADELIVDSKYDMTANSFSGSYLKGPEMWTETPTNTGKGCEESWTETSTNTGSYVEPWGSYRFSESGTISVAPETFYIDGAGNKSDQEKLAESVKFIESLLAQEKQVETKNSPNILKNTENKSRTELISKIVADVIEELLTKGTCSLNITLGQE